MSVHVKLPSSPVAVAVSAKENNNNKIRLKMPTDNRREIILKILWIKMLNLLEKSHSPSQINHIQWAEPADIRKRQSKTEVKEPFVYCWYRISRMYSIDVLNLV